MSQLEVKTIDGSGVGSAMSHPRKEQATTMTHDSQRHMAQYKDCSPFKQFSFTSPHPVENQGIPGGLSQLVSLVIEL
jgi:hypothetical protein